MTSPSGPAEPANAAALLVVERAAAAVARGDLVELNAAVHPRALAELARIAGEDDAERGPPITAVVVAPAPGGSDREPHFTLQFIAADRSVSLQVAAQQTAATWRIGRILGIDHDGGPP